MSTDKSAQWLRAWQELDATPPEHALRDLITRYSEPGRAYHTMRHIIGCLRQFASVRQLAERPAEVELAIWFHDAIYDTRSSDSEERSAQLAKDYLTEGGVSAERVGRIHNLILQTKHRKPPKQRDASLLVDVDLAILSVPTRLFEKYEAQIRQEYSWVPIEDYRRERCRVLQTFLDRPQLYSTSHFVRALEKKARANLAQSISQLRSEA